MLTGAGYRAESLTPDQIARVQHLIAIDAGMRTIHGDDVGEWMVTGSNGAGHAVRIIADRLPDPRRHCGLRGACVAGWYLCSDVAEHTETKMSDVSLQPIEIVLTPGHLAQPVLDGGQPSLMRAEPVPLGETSGSNRGRAREIPLHAGGSWPV